MVSHVRMRGNVGRPARVHIGYGRVNNSRKSLRLTAWTGYPYVAITMQTKCGKRGVD